MPDYDEFRARDYRTTPRTKRRHIGLWITLIVVFTLVALAILANAVP
jgi:hypothetical protein